MKIRDISIGTCLALLLMGCVAKPPMATENEMKEAAAFAFNVDASQVTISDARQQDVKTNFVATIGKTSHRCYVTKAAEPKLYGLIPLGGGSTVSDAICAGANPTLASKTCDALSQKAGRC